MVKYNHAYTFGFSLESTNASGRVSGAELRKALLDTLERYADEEIEENCGLPFDTYEVEQ